MKSKVSILYISALLGFSGAVFAEGKTAQEYHREALKKDAETIAEIYQISHEDAFRRLKLQEAAGERLVAQIKEEFKERFAGSYIEHDPVDRMVVRLKGDAEVATRKLEVEGDVLLVEFKSGQPYTKNELENIFSKKQEELSFQIKNIQGHFVDEKTGEIVLIVFIREEENDEAGRIEAIAKNIIAVPVRIHRVPVEFSNFAPVRGGANLSILSSIPSGCTSGFVVKKLSDSTRGVLTAGHCLYGDGIYSDENGNTVLLKEQQSVNSLTADVKWYKSAFNYPPSISAQMEPKFYGESGVTPTTLAGKISRSILQKGELVCHRGKTTGYSCGVIASTSFGLQGCNEPSCEKWIVVFPPTNTEPGLACAGGDSGGPAFRGAKAVGIMHGGHTQGSSIGQCVGAVYMSTDEIGVIGVELLYGS